MPRTPGEKEKVEKRIRIEKAVIPIVCVIAVSAFILISAVLGKNRVKDTSAPQTTETPAPTVSPCSELIESLYKRFNGEINEGTDSASLFFKSPTDGADVTVIAYLSSGETCLRIVRNADAGRYAVITTPDVTESIFIVDRTEQPEAEISYDCSALAGELSDIISALTLDGDSAELRKSLDEKLVMLLSGGAKKASVICGARMIELEYNASDGILKVTVEPI